jgi:peptide/nickel transport system permease protein
MPGFLIRRLIFILTTLFVVTVVLYLLAMVSPPEERAMLYFPNTNAKLTEAQEQRLIDNIIKRYGLADPFWIQYSRWIGRMLRGNWGYSPVAKMNVVDALLQRTPASVELIFYTMLLFIPAGIYSGLRAGKQKNSLPDISFRFLAFISTSTPPFILGIVLLSIFWVGLHWFSIERLSINSSVYIHSSNYQVYTGLVTIDALLNRKPEIALDALRHLVLPVLTLSILYWAILGRVTRGATIEELSKLHILAARARGITEKRIIWRHTFRNVLVPALNISALSIANLITSLYIVESVFLYNGISSLFVRAYHANPDMPMALGFVIYTTIVVLALMTLLDILQALVDPRLRQGGLQ